MKLTVAPENVLASQNTRRRGMSLVIVLGIISITMAVSYALVRTQGTIVQVQSNSQLGPLARQAAMTALAAGLRKMHQSDWAGVDTTLSGSIGSNESYSVSFQTGDATLLESDPEAADWPYRVTLRATGYAVDPTSSGASSTHLIEAVVRLVPRQLATEPASWSSMLQHTVYQTHDEDVWLQLPARVQGSVRLQGRLRFCSWYPEPDDALQRYLSDLNSMRIDGQGDYRPLDGPVNLPYIDTPASTRLLLTSNLGISTVNIPKTNASGWNHPGLVTGYQIYPGGKVYSIPTVGYQLSNITLQPDPRSNPLGIFFRDGDVQLHDNVTIRGTLVTTRDVEIHGSNVLIESVALPSLYGASEAVHLPAAQVGDDFEVNEYGQGAVRGLVAVWDRFEVTRGSEEATLDMQGRLITRKFEIDYRWQWNAYSDDWRDWWEDFEEQLEAPPSERISYFPLWLDDQQGMHPEPLLTIRPENSSLTYHWKNPNDPVYVPHASDPGLRWTMVRWTDNP